jgi:hypothetical protein
MQTSEIHRKKNCTRLDTHQQMASSARRTTGLLEDGECRVLVMGKTAEFPMKASTFS